MSANTEPAETIEDADDFAGGAPTQMVVPTALEHEALFAIPIVFIPKAVAA
jgi:hypothetical protein